MAKSDCCNAQQKQQKLKVVFIKWQTHKKSLTKGGNSGPESGKRGEASGKSGKYFFKKLKPASGKSKNSW
jgi:hypothetical protein